MYKWIKLPKHGELVLPELALRVQTGGCTPTVHDKGGTYFPSEWMRIEEEPEVDLWLFEKGPVRAVAVKTAYRNAWTFDRWIKLYPR